MTTKTKMINGYTVELDVYVDHGEDRSDCTVSRGRYSASLALLEDGGYLEHNDDGESNTYPVADKDIVAISDWATKNGY